MKIYYSNADDLPDVESASPVEANENETKRVLSRIGDCLSFLGIVLDGRRVLQMHATVSATIYAEILDTKDLTLRYCEVNVPLAEFLIEAAFRNEDFEEKISFARLEWKDGKASPTNPLRKPS